MRVLVIEDDADVSAFICGGLANAGHSVVAASNGTTGDCVARASTYHAVILDLGLPGIDGFTLLRLWRKDGLTVPVVIVTARSGWSTRVSVADAGADDFLEKPFVMGELLKRLEASVTKRSAAPVATN